LYGSRVAAQGIPLDGRERRPRGSDRAGRGLEPQATLVASGVLEELEARAVWSERHRALFERPAR
jgi:hypothetical protein